MITHVYFQLDLHPIIEVIVFIVGGLELIGSFAIAKEVHLIDDLSFVVGRCRRRTAIEVDRELDGRRRRRRRRRRSVHGIRELVELLDLDLVKKMVVLVVVLLKGVEHGGLVDEEPKWIRINGESTSFGHKSKGK